ncbi:hypothetical protein E2C01_079609 [Portunus trituberculatus]|uniref:Uncharacterized protein n=1 Tax=Portunus trituberculatus TaxID=210409 RepID=A0A5B7IRU8_PORTR|nr:hypothetical protein [Portunus trituberculatus]
MREGNASAKNDSSTIGDFDFLKVGELKAGGAERGGLQIHR